MVDVWNSIKSTVKSVGGSSLAPAGLVWDVASAPFDDDDDNILSNLANRARQLGDPILNPKTISGGVVDKALGAMMWAYEEGVDQPLATTQNLQRNAFGGRLDQMIFRDPSALFSADNWSQVLDKGSWASAYNEAQDQSFGSAYTEAAYGSEFVEQHPTLAKGISLGTDVATMLVADPTYLALKGAGVVRAGQQFRTLQQGEKADLFRLTGENIKTSRLKPTVQSRTDKYLDWINGQNSTGRPLTGPEILHGTPELKRYAAEPHVIAGLLADASKIGGSEARNAQRRIMAVAAGDVSQIERLKTMSGETATLADTLANAQRGKTIDLAALGAQPTLATDPVFIKRLESQLDNLNTRGDIDRFVDDFNGRIDQLLETQHTMPRLPGVHTAGKRAVNRLNDTGALRSGANAHKAVDGWAAKRAAEAKSASTIFQRGLHTVPVVSVKTVGLMASPYTKAPVAISDALRQTHFTGVANLHDWGAATTQLDSMMKIARVPAGERMKTLSEAFLAKTEIEKVKAINQVEGLALKSMARDFSARAGHEIDEDYITTLLAAHAGKRGRSLTSIQGRAYAATEMPSEMATRANSAGRAQDAADLRQSTGWNTERQGKWRVDQINDDGTPLSLPLLETQLTNSVPLMDMDIARKLMQRDSSYLARLSRSWREESREMARLAELKRTGANGVDRALEARAAAADWLVDAGQMFMRAWKFSVLFRLGYPLRVLTDDHMRIWSRIGAGSFYGENLGEVGANWRYNRFERRSVGKERLHNLKVRRQEITDELDGDIMTAHLERQSDLALVEKAIAKDRAKLAALRESGADADAIKTAEGNLADNEAGRAYLLEQLGDYGPDALKRELEGIDEAIGRGWRGLADEPRKVGSADVKLPGGETIPGAFGGEYGSAYRGVTSSAGSFDNQLKGVEDRMHRVAAGGSHRTIQASEPGHLHAWADVLNNQFRASPAAMHFINGGSLDDFVRMVKGPEGAELRKRVPHFAHDPEDWGGRIQALVHDYIPTDELRLAVASGRVKPLQLSRMYRDPSMRPAVHGRAVADNIGTSNATLGVGKALNGLFRYLSEVPTDRLSRHPYFNAMYKTHARETYSVMRAKDPARRFTQDDLDQISHTARKLAMRDLRQTLFDVSAHSHAAHVMRFVSPFFAAHQEGVARWWGIAADNPQVIRRYTQAFDVPRVLEIEVDENGDLVKPGSPISKDHRILLQMPRAFGGPDPTTAGGQSAWSINEQAFNIALPGGLTNPGVGPYMAVPLEWAAQTYASDPNIARVARIFNPYPPNSPQDALMPATFKRLAAYAYGKTGTDLAFGVGEREYNASFSQYVQDLTVDFMKENGREPNRAEARELVDKAGTEATSRMWHRALWNGLSPMPANPRSKYTVVQQGWYKIQEQARSEGKDFDWAYAKFRDKWGPAYMPLIYSTSNNPAWVDADPASVAAIKQYKGLLGKIDPALTRMVIGPYAAEMMEKNATLGEYSPEARNYLRSEQMQSGSSDTYYSFDEPRQAFEEQQARRGWQQYGELTASLTNQAQAMGLASYEESDVLVNLKRAGVEQLRQQNPSLDREFGTFDSTKYDRYLDDMRTIVASPQFKGDASRTDIQVLAAYLKLRDYFSATIAQRQAQGLGGPDAAANEPLRQQFTQLVGALVESNTYFEEFAYNGGVERDPLLLRNEGVPVG